MEHIQYRFLALSIIAIIFMIGIGIMIAEQSTVGVVICIIGLFGTMGYGFSQKRKWQKD